jgi:hypothetical protein
MRTDTLAADVARAPGDSGSQPPLRRVAIMAAIAAALGVVVFLTVVPGLKAAAPKRTGEPVVALDPKQIRQVEVTPRDGSPYSFARKNGGWVMVGPAGEGEVPSDRLDGFLETLAGLTRLVVIDEPDLSRAQFGLDPPRAVVTMRGDQDIAIAIGDRNPPLTALYVQVLPRTNIVLVGAVLLWEFDKLAALARTQPVEPRERTGVLESR